MSLVLDTTVETTAPPAAVWSVLTDLEAYASWNPFIVEASGALASGGRLTLRMQPVGGRATTVRPRVLDVEDGRRLRWLGRIGVPGLLDAEHDFVLEPHDGGTRVTQRETFRGVLVPLVARTLRRSTLPAFELMNAALRRRAEAAVSRRG